ncbi:MAG: hypothetical protein KDC53_22635, partial [Saprospiraceae bacterium]|nr:hypothetical protein [Saprospiraceae bacterium]
DRFWICVHYVLLKMGRGEYLEAFDFFGYLRMVVFGPLLNIKNDKLPRGVRKAEFDLDTDDLNALLLTIPDYNLSSLFQTLHQTVNLYRNIRSSLFDQVRLQTKTELRVMQYFHELENSLVDRSSL